MKTIPQRHLPVRTLVLIGMVILITAQAYAQNANARLTLTLRNATLKEFVKRIENSTGYSFIYGEEINISHKINLKVKDMPLHEILDLVFKDEPISYQFSERYILLQKKKKQKPVSRKFTISGYVTDGTSSETLIGTNIISRMDTWDPPCKKRSCVLYSHWHIDTFSETTHWFILLYFAKSRNNSYP